MKTASYDPIENKMKTRLKTKDVCETPSSEVESQGQGHKVINTDVIWEFLAQGNMHTQYKLCSDQKRQPKLTLQTDVHADWKT